jgi:hypothetical protein
MDPIRPITPPERDIEPVWRIERTDRETQKRREGQQPPPREREREAPQEPGEVPPAPPADDDEPPHLIDVIA